MIATATATATATQPMTWQERRQFMNLMLLKQFTAQELDALQRVYQLARDHTDTGGGSTAAKLLLGLYNGDRFPFDLTNLRRLDDQMLTHALRVMEMDSRHCRAEVHVVLAAVTDDPAVQARMECWAFDLGLKGRAKKGQILEQRAQIGGGR